jgi:uracil-DNA glycosylase family 4
MLPKGSPVINFIVRGRGGNAKPLAMTVTPEHPFYVGGSWKPACELEPGDRLLVLGDGCELCRNEFFVRYDRYDERAWRTCGPRCHNKRTFHSPEVREKVRLTMKQQYQDGRRDARTIALRANEVTRQLVAAGLAKIQRLTATERYRGRIALAGEITAGRRRGMTGFGEAELKPILDRLGVDYVHLFALPGSAFLFDFCLTAERILIEVRGPGFAAGAVPHERALLKEGVAAEHGYLVLNLWWAQILHQPSMVEELLRRILRNHHGEYCFVEAMVVDVVRRRTRRDFPLYNIGVEEDESYVAAGIVSHNCRPPGNRNPEPDELDACAPFLGAQLGVIQPKVVLALGSVATRALLKTKEPIGKLRGRVHPYGSAVLVPTFHPAFLLRNPGPEYKRMAFEDLKLARREYDARRQQ